MNDWKTTSITIRHKGEYATFFVRESPCVKRPDSKGYDASAEWSCNSSFGSFGHYWSSMGEPFGEFIKDIDDDYLLGKIGRRVVDSEKVIKELRRLVIQHRKDKVIDKDTAREALDAIRDLAQYDDGEVLYHKLYESPELSKCQIEWCDIESQKWDGASAMFVKKLWPVFVKAFNEKAHKTTAEQLAVA